MVLCIHRALCQVVFEWIRIYIVFCIIVFQRLLTASRCRLSVNCLFIKLCDAVIALICCMSMRFQAVLVARASARTLVFRITHYNSAAPTAAWPRIIRPISFNHCLQQRRVPNRATSREPWPKATKNKNLKPTVHILTSS